MKIKFKFRNKKIVIHKMGVDIYTKTNKPMITLLSRYRWNLYQQWKNKVIRDFVDNKLERLAERSAYGASIHKKTNQDE